MHSNLPGQRLGAPQRIRGGFTQALFWIIFVLGNIAGYTLLVEPKIIALTPLEALTYFETAWTSLLIGELVLFVLSVFVAAVLGQVISGLDRRETRRVEKEGSPESMAAPLEGEGMQRIVRAVPFRPTAQMIWRLGVFSRWFFPGLVISVGAGMALGFFSLLSQPTILLAMTIFVPLWLIVSVLFARSAYVIPDFERLIVLRMGKTLPEIGDKIRLRPFTDEIRFRVDMREIQIPVRFNKISFRSSSTEGYVLTDPELTLFVTIIPGQAHLAATLMQDPEYAVRKNAEADLRRVSHFFTIDDLLNSSPALLDKLNEIFKKHITSWGVQGRVEISDHGLPESIRKAYEKTEAAEVEYAVMIKLASAADRVMEEWTNALTKHIPDITREEKLRILTELIGVEKARALVGEGGPATVIDVSPAIGGLTTRRQARTGE